MINYAASLFNVFKVCQSFKNWVFTEFSSITEIPQAGTLKVWHLTFSLQLPWFPEGLFPSRTDSFFFYCHGNQRNMPSLFPWWLGWQQIHKSPRILSLQSFGIRPWTVFLSRTCVHRKGDSTEKVITTSIIMPDLPQHYKHVKIVISVSVYRPFSTLQICLLW